jgi:hypothetical protein
MYREATRLPFSILLLIYTNQKLDLTALAEFSFFQVNPKKGITRPKTRKPSVSLGLTDGFSIILLMLIS